MRLLGLIDWLSPIHPISVPRVLGRMPAPSDCREPMCVRSGPDLTHVGSRRSLGAGILPNTRGTLIGWIGDSQSIKPNNRMPAYRSLPADELNALAAYMASLR